MFSDSPSDQSFDLWYDEIFRNQACEQNISDSSEHSTESPQILPFNPNIYTEQPIMPKKSHTVAGSKKERIIQGRIRQSQHSDTKLTISGSAFYRDLTNFCIARGCSSNPIREFLVILYDEVRKKGCNVPKLKRDERRIKNVFLNNISNYQNQIYDTIITAQIDLKEIEQRTKINKEFSQKLRNTTHFGIENEGRFTFF